MIKFLAGAPLLVFATIATAAPSNSWLTSAGGRTVQYQNAAGGPVDLRIGCNNGDLALSGATDATFEGPTTITFPTAERRETRQGAVIRTGDGFYWQMLVTQDDPIVARLLSGETVRIVHRGLRIDVSGEGGRDVIKSLISRCQRDTSGASRKLGT